MSSQVAITILKKFKECENKSANSYPGFKTGNILKNPRKQIKHKKYQIKK